MTDQTVTLEVADTAAATAAALLSEDRPPAAAAEVAVAAGAGPAWVESLEDADARAFVQGKGWKSPADMLGSYRSLETLIGGEKIPLPKNPEDKDGYDRLYKALGRPDTPEGYKLPVPDGSDGAFAKLAAGMFHEAGLGAHQAAVLTERWNTAQAQAAQAQEAAFEVQSGQQMGELKTEWGDRFNANLEMARRAAKQFAIEPDQLSSIERALGAKSMVSLLSRIGAGLAEDSFETGDGGNRGSFGMSPDTARARIAALSKDAGWQDRFVKGGADEKAEWNRLHLLANPGA